MPNLACPNPCVWAERCQVLYLYPGCESPLLMFNNRLNWWMTSRHEGPKGWSKIVQNCVTSLMDDPLPEDMRAWWPWRERGMRLMATSPWSRLDPRPTSERIWGKEVTWREPQIWVKNRLWKFLMILYWLRLNAQVLGSQSAFNFNLKYSQPHHHNSFAITISSYQQEPIISQ